MLTRLKGLSAVLCAAQVEMIVSGDDDLLVLGNLNGIPIVNASQALWRLDGSFAVTSAELPTG